MMSIMAVPVVAMPVMAIRGMPASVVPWIGPILGGRGPVHRRIAGRDVILLLVVARDGVGIRRAIGHDRLITTPRMQRFAEPTRACFRRHEEQTEGEGGWKEELS